MRIALVVLGALLCALVVGLLKLFVRPSLVAEWEAVRAVQSYQACLKGRGAPSFLSPFSLACALRLRDDENMHHICTGTCKGVSDQEGVCQNPSCPKHGQPLEACDCADNTHNGRQDKSAAPGDHTAAETGDYK